ncbi:MAG: hypothetical protein RQ756_01025 [Flavobacteriaceae bacterium]|nr:hypothetical protein [Flavobacteriaceae bacterium]
MLDQLKEIWLRLHLKKSAEYTATSNIKDQVIIILPPQLYEWENEIKQNLLKLFPEIKSSRLVYFGLKQNLSIPEEQQITPKKMSWLGKIKNSEIEEKITQPVKFFIVLTQQPSFYHRWLLTKSNAEYRLTNHYDLLKYADICINAPYEKWEVFIQEMKKIVGSKSSNK